MLSHEERVKERDRLRAIGKEITTKKDEILARKIDKIQQHYKGLEKRLEELRDKRAELLNVPGTREEILAAAKERLKGGRRGFIRDLLADHLALCQGHNVTPFRDTDLRIHLLDESKCWKLFFFAVTEEDLIGAAALLPDTGTSRKDRGAAIKKIDDEIVALQKEIDADLEAEKKS